MASLNQCSFIGRLGKDVETRFTQSGKEVCSFSIAIDEKRGEEKRVEWINIIAWEKLANICAAYLHKGSQVFVAGKLQTRSYDDKEGVKKYVTEIIAFNIQMLDKKADNPSSGGGDESPF